MERTLLSVQVSGDFARTGHVEISVLEGGDFDIRLRISGGGNPVLAAVNGVPVKDEASSSGWPDIRRDWQPGDVIAAGWLTGQQDGPVDFGIPGRRLSLPLRVANRPRSYWPKELHTWRFADFASPGIAGEAAYRVWFPQPTLDR